MSEEVQLRLVPEFSWREHETIATKWGDVWAVRNTLVRDEASFDQMLTEIRQHWRRAWDTETSGLNPHLGARACGHSVAVSYPHRREIRAWYVPVRHRNAIGPQLLPEYVAQGLATTLPHGRIDGHHIKFDAQMGRVDGLEVSGAEWHDTSVRANLYNENEVSFALKKLTAKYVYEQARDEERILSSWMASDARGLGIPYKKRKTSAEDLVGSPTYMELYGHSRTPIELCGIYACHDVVYTLLLGDYYESRVLPQYQEVYDRDMAVSKILLEMEWVGLPVSTQTIREADAALRRDLVHWLQKIQAVTGPDFEPTNDNSIRRLLYSTWGLEPQKVTKKKEPSVDQEALRLLARKYPQCAEFVKALVKFAKSEKLYSTYGATFLRGIDPNSHIHPSYNQIERKEEGVPVTGRLSSQDPNAQNIAKKPIELMDGSEVAPRSYFVVPPEHIYVYIDLSQIELRTLAWLSRDPELLRCYANDLDIHQMTAEEVTGGNRDIAKQVNFGTVLGLTEAGFSRRLPYYYDDPDRARRDALVYLERFDEKYRGVKQLRRRLAKIMRDNGNEFVSAFGRPRRIDWISEETEWKRERAERQMMSSAISGTAADIHKEILIRCDYVLKKMGLGGRIAQSIHDEIVFDLPVDTCRNVIPVLKRCFEHWPVFEQAGVPIKASVEVSTTTWADKRKIDVGPDGVIYSELAA